MSVQPDQEKPLPTIWRVPDELWRYEPIFSEHDLPKKTRRPRIEQARSPWPDARVVSGTAWARDEFSIDRRYCTFLEVAELCWISPGSLLRSARAGRVDPRVAGGQMVCCVCLGGISGPIPPHQNGVKVLSQSRPTGSGA